MIPLNDIYVLLPAYNEAGKIREVILGLQQEGLLNVVVIDDGSADDTVEQAKSLSDVRLVRHFVNRGAGAAIQTGIELARRNGWPHVALMDADGQHDPKDILQLQAKMSETKCDLVIGSRFMKKNEEIPKTRIVFNFIANRMTNLFCKKNYSDSQSGLRLLNRNAIENLNLQIDGFGFCSEMIIKAERAGLQIEETGISVRYTDYSIRKGQDFQMGINTAFNFLWNILFK
ncbi:MAG: glycosyltransferase family 2 protein [Bacteroidota bacterium]